MSAVRGAVLWGATGQAKVLRECLRHAGIPVVAVFDNDDHVAAPFTDVPLFRGAQGFEDWRGAAGGLEELGVLVAIGGERGLDRVEIQRRLVGHGLRSLVACHPTAFVAEGARIGPGSQILAQAAVCVEAELGEACIVNTAASVDHECVLGHGVHIAPGARVAGSVVIEDFAFVGAGAIVLPRVRVGRGAVVGAGAVVIEDVAPRAVVVGNPARAVGSRP